MSSAIDLKILLWFLSLSSGAFTLVALITYLSTRDRRHARMLFFWVINCVHLLLASMVSGPDLRIVSLGLLSSFFRLTAQRWLLEDTVDEKLFRHWHYPLLVVGFVVGGVLMLREQSFWVYTLPPILAIFVVGVEPIYRAIKLLPKSECTHMHVLFFSLIFCMQLHMLDYPFLRPMREMAHLGYYITIIITVMIGAILPGLIYYSIQRAHQRELERLVAERSEQLMAQAPRSVIGPLASGVAHEINNPLSIISAWAQILNKRARSQDISTQELVKGLEKVSHNSQRIAKIVKSLRDFSEIDQREMVVTRTSMEWIVEEALTFCQERFQAQEVKLKLKIAPDNYVMAYRVELTQGLLYLLMNSFDAVKEKKERWIEIESFKKNDRVQLVVRDSGDEIPLSVQTQMMQPFFSTKPKDEGVGMGLPMVKNIVEKHEGILSFEPLPHTTFIIDLPLSV